jgi:hypothetical protein
MGSVGGCRLNINKVVKSRGGGGLFTVSLFKTLYCASEMSRGAWAPKTVPPCAVGSFLRDQVEISD